MTELVAQVEEFALRGFSAYKLKVGQPTLSADGERLESVRKVLGQEGLLMVDANMGLTLAEAKRMAAVLERYDVFWLEEPLIPEDVAGHAALSQMTAIPIAAGENLYTRYQFQDYFRASALHIVQADVIRCGGITEWLKIAELAQAANLPMAPHFVAELHVHLLCAVPNALILEYLPWFDALVEEPLSHHGGIFAPPDRPGHGVRFDLEKLSRYRTHVWSTRNAGD